MLDIEKVPVREAYMTPYEILLSESQERMLCCVKPGKEAEVTEVFSKWGLDSDIIGEVTDDGLFTVRLNGEIISQVPSEHCVLGGGAPVYKRETKRPAYMDELAKLDLNEFPLDSDWSETLIQLLGSPNICHKGWVFDQYDSMVRTNTAVGPGSDAAVLRIRKTNKALAMTTDCNGRYCYLNPRLGASAAVAESARNIVCSGGRPLAITNCLNFGNPYKPEIYYCFAEAIAGMGEACRVFDTPVTGGNVSFYNEDPERAVFPTPTIGMIGLVEDTAHITTSWFKEQNDVIILIGETKEELGASEYLHALFGKTQGEVPTLDLQFEKKMQATLLDSIQAGEIKSAHDLSEGGLAISLAECCMGDLENPMGASVTISESVRADCLLFGESQSRVIITCAPGKADAVLARFNQSGVKAEKIGTVGGSNLKINALIDLPTDRLIDAFYNSMPAFMNRID